MMKLDGIVAFVAAAEEGSISGAARRLGVSKSVVSDRLAELERVLGTALLQRTTRKLSVTTDGVAFLERARRIVRETTEAVAELSVRRGTLSGPLRLSAPVSFGTLHLGPALYPFLRDNPGVDLTLELSDHFVDVAADGFDAVIRHADVRDRHLVVKRLAQSRRLLVAAPAYLAEHGTPRTLDELGAHAAILYTGREADWRFTHRGKVTVVRPMRALRVNNGLLMRDAAVAGLGITLLPTFMSHPERVRGSLAVVDLEADADGAEVHLLYPREHGGSAKLQALAAHLRAAFGEPPYWDLPP